VCGNKIDLPEEKREVSKEELKKLETKWKVMTSETTAKEHEAVNDAFVRLACQVLDSMEASSSPKRGCVVQ